MFVHDGDVLFESEYECKQKEVQTWQPYGQNLHFEILIEFLKLNKLSKFLADKYIDIVKIFYPLSHIKSKTRVITLIAY